MKFEFVIGKQGIHVVVEMIEASAGVVEDREEKGEGK